MGTRDVGETGVVDQFDNWKDTILWAAIAPSTHNKLSQDEIQPGIEMEISTDKRASTLRQDMSLAIVKDAKTLTSPPEKRHLEFQLLLICPTKREIILESSLSTPLPQFAVS